MWINLEWFSLQSSTQESISYTFIIFRRTIKVKGIQENMQKCNMHTTMELVGKVKGGTTEYGNITSSQLSKQCALCK